MLHRRQPAARPTDRHPRSRGRRRATAALAGLLAAATAVLGGLVAGQHVAGPASAATAPKGSPYGVAEHIWFRPGGLYFSGWTLDPSAPKQAITAYVLVDGKMVAKSVANLARPDVARAHPTAGPNHGFKFTAQIPEGRHQVCVKARNVGAGVNVVLRCQTRILDYGPVGAVQKVSAAHGQVSVSGWTFDYDNRAAPLTVSVSVDGKATKIVADDPTSATAQIARAGRNHGFTVTQPAAQGAHKVCVVVTNLGFGTNTSFPCSTVTLNDSPRASLDSAAQGSGKLRIKGWAFDPDAPTTAATVLVKIDGTTHTVTANASRPDVGSRYPGVGDAHGFSVAYGLSEGSHTVCVTARNVGFGGDVTLPCRTARLNFTPTARIISVTGTRTGLRVSGWATDPDTTNAISVRVAVDGKPVKTLTASRTGKVSSGHEFRLNVVSRSGQHPVCVTGLNALYGTHDSAPACRTLTLALSPFGAFESLTRPAGSTDLKVVGWAYDPDTTGATTVAVTLDGVAAPSVKTGVQRTDVATTYPSAGSNRGFAGTIPTPNDGEHTVCLTAKNVSGGADVPLGCKLIIAAHPVAPSMPQNVTAQAGYGGATVTWKAPASDGGAPWSKYVVTSSSGGSPTTVSASATSATVVGLKPSTPYSFTVQAVNVAGASVPATTPVVQTQASPPAQTTPAPVSTSRYIRNIRGSSATELAVMRQEGATDAYYNPSGHGYVVLLDIGGQDNIDGGVVLSATTRFVGYADLVRDLEAYVDGYASKQKASAPAIIALGTNNDMEVSSTAGRAWADKVVDPVVAYTRAHHPGLTIAGANDIEPGFRATYSQTRAWLSGYLASTSAPFIFNGSADGCAWTTINRGCNNGWSMSGLYYLSAGAAPIRMLNLPQIYNYTMADQWKYISLTGVANGQPRINFAGTLTEWTACDQTGGCGSIPGRTAWSKMWSNLQSDSRLKVGSLPYATDLRIDR